MGIIPFLRDAPADFCKNRNLNDNDLISPTDHQQQ